MLLLLFSLPCWPFAKVLNEIREEEKKEKKRQEAESFPENRIAKNGQFYRGTLRSGQKIEVDGSIVILGDIKYLCELRLIYFCTINHTTDIQSAVFRYCINQKILFS